jgi:ribonuclease D
LELRSRSRENWVREECDALAAIAPAKRVFDPEDCVRVKGARDLDRRALAILRELFVARESWAREAGRPPFKVLGNESLVRLAVERPRTRDDLRKIPGCTAGVVQRYGEGLLAAMARGVAVPQAELPTYPRPKNPRVPPATQRRLDALTRWRAGAAERLGLDPGLLLPRRLIEQLAEKGPADCKSLEAIEGIRRWRVESFGQEILEALKAAWLADRPRRTHPAGAGR